MYFNFLLSILSSALISFYLTPKVRNFFILKNWLEDPRTKNQKTHNATAQSVLPRGGGLPIYIAVLVATLVFLPLDKHLFGILLAGLFTLLVGLWDDIRDISPLFRLVCNILTALVVVAAGIGIAFISNPLGGIIDLSYPRFIFDFFGPHQIWILSDALAIVWIVWCMNTVGWASGIEGQLPGFVSISAFFIGILGLTYSTDISEWPVIIMAGAVCGSYLGFLPFNYSPQTIMPGYSGKSLAGFFLAVLAILSGAKLATVIFLLGIPMLDAVFTILRRIKNKKPIYLGDGQHLHHKLLSLGWSRQNIAKFYWLLTFILGLISLFLNSQQKFYVFLGLSLLFFSFLILLYQRKA